DVAGQIDDIRGSGVDDLVLARGRYRERDVLDVLRALRRGDDHFLELDPDFRRLLRCSNERQHGDERAEDVGGPRKSSHFTPSPAPRCGWLLLFGGEYPPKARQAQYALAGRP